VVEGGFQIGQQLLVLAVCVAHSPPPVRVSAPTGRCS
jgi:hypothetical protein